MSRIQKAVIVVITLILVLLGISYGTGYYYFGSHFLPGTELNEFDISFKTVGDVQNLLDQKVKSYAIAVDEKNGGREKIDAKSIGMKYKPNGSVQELLSKQKRLLWFVSSGSYERVDLGFMLDEELLNEQIAELDCMKNMAAPSDARILYKEGEGYILIPEKEGSKVNIDDAAALIDTAIRGGESSVDISECYEEPKIRESDLKEKYEALKKFQDIIITYDFGDRTETLDIHKIQDFIVDNELNKEKVAEYVEQLAAKYDTKGVERSFVTYADNKITVSGGDYGWKIEHEKETEDLMKDLLSGQTDVRTPVYEQEAMERDSNDIGYTYIEIDKANKQFILYADGDPIIQTTGIVSSLDDGVYALKEPLSDSDGKSWYLPFGAGQCIYGMDLNQDENTEVSQDEIIENPEDIDINELIDQINGVADTSTLPEVEDGSMAIQNDSAEQAFSICKTGIPVIVY